MRVRLTISLCWRKAFASEKLFCLKKTQTEGDGSVGTELLSVTNPVRMRV